MTDETPNPAPEPQADPPKPAEVKEAAAEDAAAQKTVDASEDLISKANAAAIRIEEANKESERINAETTKLAVEKTLAGKAEAGTAPEKETPEDYAKRVMANDV